MSDGRGDAQVQSAARALFNGCAPERKTELDDLWERFAPEFQVHEDNHPNGPFLFDAGAYKYVRFNNRAMRLIWLGAFIAWEAFSATPETQQTAPDWTRLKAMLSTFNGILAAVDPETVPYPSGVPLPGVYLDGKANPEERAVGELATIASGWALLHEFRHIQNQQSGTAAALDDEAGVRAEELDCDSFATTFLTKCIGDYAASSGYPADKVRCKRQLAIYISLFNIALLTNGHWEQSATHPALRDRIDAVKAIFGADRQAEAEHVAELAFQALGCILPGAPHF
ncbi:phage exclusion protein Lit family protein [Azospirillum sp. SYSU D00513]|uniref:phage exclusion protein Lit family protein n=1 Tax=Azospirillum sp. SYSU D00513 TaxID=2812561 RepID=UPI001A95CFD7|nr:phage exclusion protein Lit family protein [Azospirillum sp. SYSU D00513]